MRQNPSGSVFFSVALSVLDNLSDFVPGLLAFAPLVLYKALKSDLFFEVHLK